MSGAEYDIEQVRATLRACATGNRNPVKAVTFRRKFQTASRPVLVHGEDGHDYVMKGSHNGRRLVADHVVARVGQLLGAPVGLTCFGNVPQELIAIEPQLSNVGAGLCHATKWVPDCTDRHGLDHMDKPYNRERFALLQVLYSIVLASDHQLIYAKSEPFLVYSVDHGHFFNGSTGWTPTTLRQIGPVVLDGYFSGCGLSNAALAAARLRLVQVTDDDFELIVKGVPDEWGMTPDDRSALVEYLKTRRDRVLPLLPTS